MKYVFVLLPLLLAIGGCSDESGNENQLSVKEGLVSDSVWAQVKSDRYKTLPNNSVSLLRFTSGWFGVQPDKLIKRAAKTVSDRENIIPHFDKLVHANGICLKGRWVITEKSVYTGFFTEGTNAPFIGRASVAFSETTRGNYRAFGLAGKIFDESNGSEKPSSKTANFFTIDDLAGTIEGEFSEVVLRNQPALTATNLIAQGPIMTALGAATALAFRLADSHPEIRQVYQISELGLKDRSKAITPQWMDIRGISQRKYDWPDFRDDLSAANYEGKLTFEIKVSSRDQESMVKIGEIIIDDRVASQSCDHRLHFNHPKFRNDLKYQ